ncbi:GTP-binding protein [Kordiimonas sp. SCSIO 12610]|uniref:CobW family GTP-binding protein n=1 Tax=Kordiimonas sp. SCSIO 12610 TaxID=2829597 RepID=UPI00210AB6E3|nr:GTP-binding protein [Kordiimonas sp. SCSIO 12610]UTW54638.1 GTP-binding protein [Kordiimonas sp. SCSIO 12610]
MTSSRTQKNTEIPITVISGYLGVGKTTFLRRLIELPDSRQSVFIVNDFGSLNIDAAIVEMNGGNTFQLENGCICCSLVDGLVKTLLEIKKLDPRPKRIIIEASGIANPKRISEVGQLSRSYKDNGIITIVDASTLFHRMNDYDTCNLLNEQIRAAKTVIVNKTDRATANMVKCVLSSLRDVNPKAELQTTSYMQFSDNVLMNFLDRSTIEMPTDDFIDSENHNMATYRFQFPQSVSRTKLISFIEGLPDTIHRVKGFVKLSDRVNVMAIERSGLNQVSISEAVGVSKEVLNEVVIIGTREMPHLAELQLRLKNLVQEV